MAQLYKVHGGERALCPFTGNCCYTDCAWLIPHFCNDGEVGAYTCCMNNLDSAALMTEEKLEEYEEQRTRGE